MTFLNNWMFYFNHFIVCSAHIETAIRKDDAKYRYNTIYTESNSKHHEMRWAYVIERRSPKGSHHEILWLQNGHRVWLDSLIFFDNDFNILKYKKSDREKSFYIRFLIIVLNLSHVAVLLKCSIVEKIVFTLSALQFQPFNWC